MEAKLKKKRTSITTVRELFQTFATHLPDPPTFSLVPTFKIMLESPFVIYTTILKAKYCLKYKIYSSWL